MTRAEEINIQVVSPVSTLGGAGAVWTDGGTAAAGISALSSSAKAAPAIKEPSINNRIKIFFITSPLS
jgi:hypothetical protein